MPQFHTRNNRPKTIPCPTGSAYENDYVLDNGCVKASLVRHNRYREIQEAADSCSIYGMIDRYVNGDMSAIPVANGSGLIDYTGMPTSLMEAYDVIQSVDQNLGRIIHDYLDEQKNAESEVKSDGEK